MHFYRFLRKNPDDEKRWTVWDHLLVIALNISQDNATAREYLEFMLEDFASDPPRRRRISLELASLCNQMRTYSRAVELWEGLLEDPGLPDEERAWVVRMVAQAYLRRMEFTPAAELLEQCLSLPVAPAPKADCLSSLAAARLPTHALQGPAPALPHLLPLP